VALGDFAPGEAHSYRFTVTFPERGAGDNAVAGASATLRYSWTATDASGQGGTGITSQPPTGTTSPPQPPTGGHDSIGTGTGTPADTTAPRLTLGGPAKQGLKAPYVTARCDEACVLYPTATVTGVKGLTKLRVVAPAKAIAPGTTVRLTVVAGKPAAKTIARAVKSGRKVRIRISVAAHDRAKNESAGARVVTLKR
jgi:hypothetical protein